MGLKYKINMLRARARAINLNHTGDETTYMINMKN